MEIKEQSCCAAAAGNDGMCKWSPKSYLMNPSSSPAKKEAGWCGSHFEIIMEERELSSSADNSHSFIPVAIVADYTIINVQGPM